MKTLNKYLKIVTCFASFSMSGGKQSPIYSWMSIILHASGVFADLCVHVNSQTASPMLVQAISPQMASGTVLCTFLFMEDEAEMQR